MCATMYIDSLTKKEGTSMKIKKIKKLSGGKYKIEFTDAESIVTYDSVILENNILLKKEIDSDTYIKMSSQNSYYEIYTKAVRRIVTKLRSEKEMREYLKKYTEEQSLIEKIIEQLKKEGLLNDERYIKAFIEDKVNLTTWGPYKIKRELEKLDMDEEKVKDGLNKYDSNIFEDKLKKIISKKEQANKKNSKYVLKQKLERELIDLGYSSDMIKENLSNITINETQIINKEVDKLYRKLSQKYSGQNLYYNLKQKLSQKGFTIDSINDVLESYMNE